MEEERSKKIDQNMSLSTAVVFGSVISEIAIVAVEASPWLQVFPLAAAGVSAAVLTRDCLNTIKETRRSMKEIKFSQELERDPKVIFKQPS